MLVPLLLSKTQPSSCFYPISPFFFSTQSPSGDLYTLIFKPIFIQANFGPCSTSVTLDALSLWLSIMYFILPSFSRFWHVSSYHFLLKIKPWGVFSPLISILLDTIARRPMPKWNGRLTHSPPCKKKIAVIKISQANCFYYNTHCLSPSPLTTCKPPKRGCLGAEGPRDTVNKLWGSLQAS